jgi:hypothetical protein
LPDVARAAAWRIWRFDSSFSFAIFILPIIQTHFTPHTTLMKKTRLILALLSFVGFAAFGQTTEQKTVKGTVSAVHAFNNEFSLTIQSAEYILLTAPKESKRKQFLINKKYKDLLIPVKGEYVLNPKYAGKTLLFSYYVNGKGWNCIKTIQPSK